MSEHSKTRLQALRSLQARSVTLESRFRRVTAAARHTAWQTKALRRAMDRSYHVLPPEEAAAVLEGRQR